MHGQMNLFDWVWDQLEVLLVSDGLFRLGSIEKLHCKAATVVADAGKAVINSVPIF